MGPYDAHQVILLQEVLGDFRSEIIGTAPGRITREARLFPVVGDWVGPHQIAE